MKDKSREGDNISRLPRLMFLSCIRHIRIRKLAKNTGRVRGVGDGPTITKQPIEIIVFVNTKFLNLASIVKISAIPLVSVKQVREIPITTIAD